MNYLINITENERELLSEQLNIKKSCHKKQLPMLEHHMNWKPKSVEFRTKYKKEYIRHQHCIDNINTLLDKLTNGVTVL